MAKTSTRGVGLHDLLQGTSVHVAHLVVAVVFGAVCCLGKWYAQLPAVAQMPKPIALGVMAFRLVLYSAVFFAGECLLLHLASKKTDQSLHSAGVAIAKRFGWGSGKCARFMRRYNRGLRYAALALMWVPFLLIKFPGALCWDTWDMLNRYFHGVPNNHHSIAFTLAAGSLVSAFEGMGHPGWGLWLFVCLIFALMVFVFGYAWNTLVDLGVPAVARAVLVCLWVFDPYVIGYIGVLMKDVPYSVLFLLLTCVLVRWKLGQHAFPISAGQIALLVACCLGICLCRKNGAYILFVLALVVLVIELKCRLPKRLSLVLGLAFVLFLATEALLMQVSHASPTDPNRSGEAFSLPFQQTARYVRDHGDELEDWERSAIDNILHVDTLAQRYDPRIADPVKDLATVNGDTLMPYLRAWFHGLVRHPGSYFSATMEQFYYLFVPSAEQDDVVLYLDDDVGYELNTRIAMSELTDVNKGQFVGPAFLVAAKEWAVNTFEAMHNNPFIAVLCNVSFNFYVFMLLFVLTLLNGKPRDAVAYLPALFTVAFVFLGPVLHGHPRYMFPVIYAVPLLLGYWMYCCRQRQIDRA